MINIIVDDELAFKIIQKKIIEQEVFDAPSIAASAFRSGRKELALKIATLEPSPFRSVPFFMSLGKWEDALQAASLSCDPTLIATVILHAIDSKYPKEKLAKYFIKDEFSMAL